MSGIDAPYQGISAVDAPYQGMSVIDAPYQGIYAPYRSCHGLNGVLEHAILLTHEVIPKL